MRCSNFTVGRRAAACVLSLLVACGQVDPQAELADAQASFAAEDYRTAAIHVSTVLQADPDNAAARLLRGQIALAFGDAATAREEVERARALGAPPDAAAPTLAEAFLRLGDPQAALGAVDEIPEIDRDAALWTLRGMALAGMAEFGEAQASFDRSASLEGATAINFMGRAQLAALRNDFTEANRLMAEAAAVAPDDPDIASAQGALYLHDGRLSDAVAALQAAADRYADNYQTLREAGVRSVLVQAHLALGDTDAAAEAAGRLAALVPNAAAAEYAEGLVAYQRGRFADAVTVLQRAVAQQPDNPRLVTLLGATQLALGNLGQAEQEFLRVLASTPDDPAAVKLLAETRLRQQRPEAALESLRPLADRGTEDAQIALLSGLASLQAGDTAQAIVYLRQAAALNPASQATKLALARAYTADGQSEAAAALLDEAFDAAGGEGIGPDLLRLFALVQSGDIDRAREQAAALLEEFPGEPQPLTAAAAFYRLIGEPQTATAQLEAAIEADASFVPARLLLAELLASDGRQQEAERQLRAVLEQDDGQVQALTALAQLMIARGETDEAEALFRNAIVNAPEDRTLTATRLMLGRLYLRTGRVDDAGQQIAAAAAETPDSVDVRVAQGLLALARNDAGEAIERLTAALEQRPSDLGATLALAEAQIAAEQPEAARQTLQAGLASVPGSLPLRAALGRVELTLGHGDEALSIAQDLQTRFPGLGPGYALEAEVRLAERRYELAADAFALALERQPTWALALRQSVALQLAGRTDEIESLYDDWVRRNPNHVPARLALASRLQARGRDEAALTHYEHVLDLQPDNALALNNAAWLHHELGRPDALALAERAYQAAPDNPAVLDTYGWILLLQNREQDAIAHLERAAQLAPQALEIRYHLAQAQAELGRAEEARSTLEALLAEEGAFADRAAARAMLESL